MQTEFSAGRLDIIAGMGFDSWALPLYLRIFPDGDLRAVAVQFLCFGVYIECRSQEAVTTAGSHE